MRFWVPVSGLKGPIDQVPCSPRTKSHNLLYLFGRFAGKMQVTLIAIEV